MTPDERRPEDLGDVPRDPVADFFAAEREDVRDLRGDDARWLDITREAGRPRRAGWLRYAVVAAAVVVIGGSAWAVGTTRVNQPVAQSRPSVTQTVYVTESPSPSAVPDPTAAAPSIPSTAGAASGVTSVPPDFAVSSVSTVRSGRLFALGRASCAGAPCALVATSSDGGATWGVRGRLPGMSVAARDGVGALTRSASTVTDVRFASDTVGWAFGATVWRTTDGGRSWVPYPHGGGSAVLDVETDGTDVVLTTAAGCAGSACSGPVTVLRAPGRATSATSAGDVGGTIDAPGVTAADIGWSAGKAVITIVPVSGAGIPPQLLLTNGLHPVGVSGCVTPGAARLVTPAAGTTLFALCPPQGATGHVVYGVAASSDGGATWTPVSSDGPSLVNAGAVSVTASDPAHLLAVSGGSADLHGSMTVSADGGRTWHDPVQPPPLPDRGWGWVGSPGPGTFYAVPLGATGDFWRSTDDGESWAPVTVAR